MFFNFLESTADTTGNGGTGSIVIFAVLIVAIIGLFIWQSITNKKKQKESQNMVDSLKKGDRVKTIGGICGFVVEINNDENTFVLETGSDSKKSYVKFDKGAIYQTAPNEGYANAKTEGTTKAKKEEKVKEEKVEEKVEEPTIETTETVETELKEAPLTEEQKKEKRRKKHAEEI